MATYRKDEYNGTQITSGIQTSRDDAAITIGHVTGITDDIAGLVSAAQAAAAARGPTHPNNSALPLRRVVSSARPPNKAVVRLEYSHKAAGGAYNSSIYSFTNPAVDVGHHPMTTYEFMGTGVEATPTKNLSLFKPITFPVPIIVLTVPVTLSANALGSVNSKIGYTNDSSVTWGGATFAANTVLFEGPRQRVRVENGSNKYDVVYCFKILQTVVDAEGGSYTGWYEFLPNGTGVLPKAFQLFDQTSFAGGAFPTS